MDTAVHRPAPARIAILCLLAALGCASRPRETVRVDDGTHAAMPSAADVRDVEPAPAPAEDATPALEATDGDEGEVLPRSDRVRVTQPFVGLCAYETGYFPVAPADLDGDGRLERVAVRRTNDGYDLTIHALPGLEVKRTAHWRADYVVPSVTRRPQGEVGDLWVHVGVVEDAATSRWRFTVERPVGDGFEPIWSGGSSGHPNFRLDVDGDGAVDPILPSDDRTQAWVAGKLVDLPIESTPDQLHGLAAAWGLDEAVDLDGDGDRDVIADAMDGLHVLELPSFRSVWKKASQGTISMVLSWAGRPAIGTHLDVLTQGRVSLLAPDAAHTVLADFPRSEDYVDLLAGVDPAGDGSLLPLHLANESALLAAAREPAPEKLGLELAVSGDPMIPQARPGRFLGGSVDELVGVRILTMGSPAVGGTGETDYELVLVPAPGRGEGRVIRRASIHGEGWIGAYVVDLENDGENEILLRESSSFAYCNIMDGGGSSSWWILLRGDGTVLWQDEPRRYEFGPDYRHDFQAKAVLVDLFPDGAHGLRLRTSDREWWVLPAARDVVPPSCLE